MGSWGGQLHCSPYEPSLPSHRSPPSSLCLLLWLRLLLPFFTPCWPPILSRVPLSQPSLGKPLLCAGHSASLMNSPCNTLLPTFSLSHSFTQQTFMKCLAYTKHMGYSKKKKRRRSLMKLIFYYKGNQTINNKHRL